MKLWCPVQFCLMFRGCKRCSVWVAPFLLFEEQRSVLYGCPQVRHSMSIGSIMCAYPVFLDNESAKGVPYSEL